MDLNSILGVLAAGSTANQIGQQFNIESNKVSSVITAALPTLIGAMQKNASTEGGANALSKALGDHSGDANFNMGSVNLTDGSKILGHILGNNSNSIFSALAKQTGTSSSQVSSILASIAPALLGLLGKGQKSSNTSAGGLGGMLGAILSGGASQKSSNSGLGMGGILGAALSDKNGNGTPDILEGFLK